MAAFIPPLSITISGNRCGGCCKNSAVRGEDAPLNYFVICAPDSRLLGVKKVDHATEAEVARKVFCVVREALQMHYNVSLEDLPIPARPINMSKIPSVAQIKRIEAVALGFKEGVKKGYETATSSDSIRPVQRSDSSGILSA
jgi:hypothetical protein